MYVYVIHMSAPFNTHIMIRHVLCMLLHRMHVCLCICMCVCVCVRLHFKFGTGYMHTGIYAIRTKYNLYLCHRDHQFMLFLSIRTIYRRLMPSGPFTYAIRTIYLCHQDHLFICHQDHLFICHQDHLFICH